MNSRRYLKYLVSIVLAWGVACCALHAQDNLDTPITLKDANPTVRQLLEQLEEKQRLRLAYSESYLDMRRNVRLRNKTPTVKEILDAIGRATNTTYQMRGDQVIFRKKGAKFTISGYVRDAATGEDLIGASVWEARTSTHGTVRGGASNEYGFYSLTLPADDTVRLRASYVGYAPQEADFLLSGDTVVNLDLTSEVSLEEVTIFASGNQSADGSTFDLPVPMADLLAAPTLLGEADVLKSLQRLPGVQAGNDGGAGLYVRGSGPGQNLILLDGVPVYNASHLLGFFSVFNADALNKIAFFKGGFPARYGGRLSSVVDIRLREGHRQQFHGTGGVGLLSSRLTLEGPIVKDKTSFLVSARRTYLDVFTRNIKALRETEFPTYWFYDLTAKVNHTFSHRDQVYLSAYTGQDQMPADVVNFPSRSDILLNPEGFGNSHYGDEGQHWGNLTATFRWNHVYNERLFSNLTLTHSRYRFGTDSRSLEVLQQPSSPLILTNARTQRTASIYDRAARIDFDYLPSPTHYVRFGGSVTRHAFRPNAVRLTVDQNNRLLLDTAVSQSSADALAYELFAEDDVRLSGQLSVNAGLHLAHFQVDKTSYTIGQPRVSVQYHPSARATGHVSYSRMAQFIHLLADPSTPLPSDLWVPTTAEVPPETAHQWTVGYQRTLGAAYAVQAEAYYKTLQNVVEFREEALSLHGADVIGDWQTLVTRGQGYSYGTEWLAQKQAGRLTGWISYSLQWSRRQFDQINGGQWFPFKYDRRHDLDIGGRFRWKDHVDVSWGWGLATGFAITLPTVAFGELRRVQEGHTVSDYSEYLVFGQRNSQRTRAAHRLDLSIAFRKKKRWGERTWEVSVYNAYSRQNPYSVYLNNYPENGKSRHRFRQISLFPILPSVSYCFRF